MKCYAIYPCTYKSLRSLRECIDREEGSTVGCLVTILGYSVMRVTLNSNVIDFLGAGEVQNRY